MINLELLTEKNIDAVRAIHREDIPVSWVDDTDTLWELTQYGLEHNCIGHTYAIKQDDDYIGVILLGEAIPWETDPEEMKNEPFYRLMGFVIDNRYRSQGIGSKVLDMVIDTIYKEYGVRPIALGVHKDNHGAARFYERHGFVAVDAMEGNDRYYLRYPKNSFWDSSWESVDPNRIAEYIETFDMGEDNVIAVMRQWGVHSVCDAGCGCGIYAAKLAANGFSISGFDVSAHAVEIAQASVRKAGYSVDFKTASILNTGYENNRFDCVLSRDVLDHISKADAIVALKELCRITKPGGIVLFTLDSLDEEYETETHIVNADGDYVCDYGCGYEFEKPEEPTPEEPTPEEPTPEEPAPEQNVPETPTPEESTPEQTTPEVEEHVCQEVSGWKAFWNSIANFFRRLFGQPELCPCGEVIQKKN